MPWPAQSADLRPQFEKPGRTGDLQLEAKIKFSSCHIAQMVRRGHVLPKNNSISYPAQTAIN
jgi:hypothetical protein